MKRLLWETIGRYVYQLVHIRDQEQQEPPVHDQPRQEPTLFRPNNLLKTGIASSVTLALKTLTKGRRCIQGGLRRPAG